MLIKYDVADFGFLIFILQHFVFVVDFHFSYSATRDVLQVVITNNSSTISLGHNISNMTEEEVVPILHAYFESLFPKICSNCNRTFATLGKYIQITERIGPPMSYDAEMKNWNTNQPIGSIAMVVCPCGTTLALSTLSMQLPLRLELLNWVKIETQRRGVSASELLEHLRDEVRKRVLRDMIPEDT